MSARDVGKADVRHGHDSAFARSGTCQWRGVDLLEESRLWAKRTLPDGGLGTGLVAAADVTTSFTADTGGYFQARRGGPAFGDRPRW